MPDWTLTDYDDREIKVGTRVRYFDYKPGHPDWGKHDQYTGTVTDLGEFDGDYDDNLGRSVSINPQVTVLFDDGTEQSYPTSEWEMDCHLYTTTPISGKVEELIVIFGHVLEEDLRDVARDVQREPDVPLRGPYVCYLGHRNCYAMHNEERRKNGDEEVPF